MQKLYRKEGLNLDKQHDAAIFQSQEHLQKEISRLCHGDLYIIGRLWVQALRTVLVGANLSLIPVVEAAKGDDSKVPPKPPMMKYEDLPIYESPHYEYKDYIEDKKKCPNSNVKILQTYLFPKVASWRADWVNSYADFKTDAGELKDEACAFAFELKNQFIRFMRDEKNYIIRQGVVITGVGTGCYIARGAGILRGLFGATVGALVTGALCFPEATDEIFRNGSFKVGKIAVNVFNSVCGRNVVLREKLPCRDDMPPPPPSRPADQRNKCK